MSTFQYALARALLPSIALLAAAGSAAAAEMAPDDLSRLSIEELAEIEVTSVSKHGEALAQAPSAIYVITSDDIRHSGGQTLAEVLRVAPNLEVMRIDALDYTITARGSASFESANKLLVLIDGRSVYTPLTSGVDWDQQHLVLGDIDRIEVISGPGGTLWGANAVNGVINVTTRSAYETQGILVSATAGTLDSDLVLRYGGQVGDGPAWRAYVTGYHRGDLDVAGGGSANDGWDGVQAGFRTDWRTGSRTLTLQGDISDNEIDDSIGAGAGFVKARNLLGRWGQDVTRGHLQVQAYYDHNERESRGFFDALSTWDVEATYAAAFGDRHQVVTGAGYRRTKDAFRLSTGPNLLDPAERKTNIGNVYVQDTIALRDDLALTLGLKWEDNNFTGATVLPNIRLGWRLSDRKFLWGAVSRAVRTPSRIERDFSIPGIVVPGIMDVETLTAYELGYRTRPLENANISVSLFYHDYDDLRTNDFTPPGVFPLMVMNNIEGKTYGVEFNGAYDVSPRWRLSGGFTLLGKDYKLKPGNLDVSGFESVGLDPNYWIKLRSEFRITDNLDLDLRMRAYDALPQSAATGYTTTPRYVEADARLAWRVRNNVELSIVGSNLLHDRHVEAPEARRSEIPRSVHAGLRWTY